MSIDVARIFENVSKVTLKGGVVGKVSRVLIVASLSMAAIAWSVNLAWVAAVAILLVFILCFVMLWRVISFADRNPQAALLEGAEFLVHEQLTLGEKGRPSLPVAPEDRVAGAPEIDAPGADLPDQDTLLSAGGDE